MNKSCAKRAFRDLLKAISWNCRLETFLWLKLGLPGCCTFVLFLVFFQYSTVFTGKNELFSI